jgi:hypothetical protein
MSGSTFFVSKPAVRILKQTARSVLPKISSSHMSEGVASALGFNTNAALLSALSKQSTTQAIKPDSRRLVTRLTELGYEELPQTIKPLPDFNHSYTPFRKYALRRKFGVRWHIWRNLLVSAINAGLEQKKFGLAEGQNWWERASPQSQQCEDGLFHFTFDNHFPATANVQAISGGELSITVFVNPRKAISTNDCYVGLSLADASAHGWLERRLGAWIQDGGTGTSCRRALQSQFAQIQIEPLGYADLGPFIF